MRYTDELLGAALLEALWSSKKKDIVDVITPFVLIGVAETTSVGKQIDLKLVAEFVEEEYGYSDFPTSIVEKVIKRDRASHFQRRAKIYILRSSLKQETDRLKKRELECKEQIDRVTLSLSEYLSTHCKKKRGYSKEETADALQDFFSRYGFNYKEMISAKSAKSTVSNEADYYISRYIFEKEKGREIEFDYINNLIQGYFLKTAIYLQPENDNLYKAYFADTVFYYDTPFLIQLLGYQSEEERRAANALHMQLKNQGGKFAFFSHTYNEIMSILTAYQYSLTESSNSSKTLEGLDELDYTSSGVDRLKRNLVKVLQDEYSIFLQNVLPYPTNEDGTVDQSKILPEEDFKAYILEKIGHYKKESLSVDICSAVGIYNLRDCMGVNIIEKSKALFVTTNKDFVRTFNNYFKKNIDRNSIPLVISDTDLSAIAWIKSSKFDSNLSQTQLLANAYMAMQPSDEVKERFVQIVNQMENEGKMSREELTSLITSRYVSNEIMERTFGDPNVVTEDFAENIQQSYKNHLEEDIKSQYLEEKEREDNKRLERAIEKALETAKTKKKRWEKTVLMIISIVLLTVFGFCLAMIIKNYIIEGFSSKQIIYFVFDVISILAFFDTIFGKWGAIKKQVQKWGNHYETKVYEEEIEKYQKIINP